MSQQTQFPQANSHESNAYVPSDSGSITPRASTGKAKAPKATKKNRYQAYKKPDAKDASNPGDLMKRLEELEKENTKLKSKNGVLSEQLQGLKDIMDVDTETPAQLTALEDKYKRDKLYWENWAAAMNETLKQQNEHTNSISEALKRKDAECQIAEKALKEAKEVGVELKDLRLSFTKLGKEKEGLEALLGAAFHAMKKTETEIREYEKAMLQKDQELTAAKRDSTELKVSYSRLAKGKWKAGTTIPPELGAAPVNSLATTSGTDTGTQPTLGAVPVESLALVPYVAPQPTVEDPDTESDMYEDEEWHGITDSDMNEADRMDEDKEIDEELRDLQSDGNSSTVESDANFATLGSPFRSPSRRTAEQSNGNEADDEEEEEVNNLANVDADEEMRDATAPGEQDEAQAASNATREMNRAVLMAKLKAITKERENRRRKRRTTRHAVVPGAAGRLPQLPLRLAPVSEPTSDDDDPMDPINEEDIHKLEEEFHKFTEETASSQQQSGQLKDLAKVTLASLKYMRSVIEKLRDEGGKPRRQTGRKARPTNKEIRDAFVNEYTQKYGHDVVKKWKARISDCFRSIYGVEAFSDFCDYDAIDDEDVIEEVEQREKQMPPTLQLYFGPAFEKTYWNRRIVEDIARSLVDKNSEEWKLPDVNRKWIQAELYGQIVQAQVEWRKARQRVGESREEAMQRTAIQRSLRQLAARSYTRKARKLENRVAAVDKIIFAKESRSRRSADTATWKWIGDVLQRLDVAGMSSDTDGFADIDGRPQPAYLTRALPWRAPEVAEYMGSVDGLIWDEYLKSVKGPSKRPRVRGAAVLAVNKKPAVSADTPAVKGLPRALYNPRWLAAMEKADPGFAEETLLVSDEKFGLLRYVAS